MDFNALAIRKEWVVLCMVSILFFTLCASLAFQFDASAYPSPDETAASVFAKRTAQGLPMSIYEPLNQDLEQIVHPRSTTVLGNVIVPQGFPLQFLLWGWLTRFTGLPIWLWTPLLGALTLPALFALFSLAFPKRVAFVTALLAFVHPAVIYYTSRGLYSSAPQVFLMLASLVSFQSPRSWRWAVGGAFLALATVLRPSEIIWITAVVALMASFHRQRFILANLTTAGVSFLLVALLAFFFHRALYGPSLIGYRVSSPVHGELFSDVSVYAIFWRAWDYLIILFWWLTIPVVGGVVILLRTAEISRLRPWRYGLVIAAVTAPLLLLYGSWNFQDSVSEQLVTIGTSFVRYWLPLSILTLPLIAYGYEEIRSHSVVVSLLVLASVLYPTVWGFESLANAVSVSRQDALMRDHAKTVLPADAVLLVERSDKIFWPKYRVIVGSAEPEKVLRLLPRALAVSPVYLHRITDLEFGSFWNAQHLRNVGLAFGHAITLDADNAFIPLLPRL